MLLRRIFSCKKTFWSCNYYTNQLLISLKQKKKIGMEKKNRFIFFSDFFLIIHFLNFKKMYFFLFRLFGRKNIEILWRAAAPINKCPRGIYLQFSHPPKFINFFLAVINFFLEKKKTDFCLWGKKEIGGMKIESRKSIIVVGLLICFTGIH